MIGTGIQKLSSQIKEVIDGSQRILLHCHPNPDADSVGSSLAMYHALKSLGKEVAIIAGDSPKPENLEALPGFTDIKQQTYTETDLSKIDLFVILDSGDITRVSSMAPVVFPSHLKTIVIDHHASNPGYGQINLIESDYPATAQILFDLFSLWGVTITPEIAICLFAGIYYDTGGFRFRATTAKTFEVAAHLVSICPDFASTISTISDQLEPGNLYFRGLAYDHIELLGHEQVALVALSYETLQQHGVKEIHTKHQMIPGTLISVKGWNIGVIILEREPGRNYVSFRARDKGGFDVSKITLLLGGGGHRPAAGAIVLGDHAAAKQKVIEAIYTAYPELK